MNMIDNFDMYDKKATEEVKIRRYKYFAAYGDIRDKEREVPLSVLLPYAILLDIDSEVLAAETKGLPEYEESDIFAKNAPFIFMDKYRNAYRFSKYAEDEMKSGNFDPICKVLEMCVGENSIADGSLRDILKEKEEGSSVTLCLDRKNKIEIPYENFTLFVKDYVVGWAGQRVVNKKFGVIPNEEKRYMEYPAISFAEAMEEGLNIREWCSLHKKDNNKKEEEKIEEREIEVIIDEFQKHALLAEKNPYYMTAVPYNQSITDLFYEEEDDTEKYYFQKTLLQSVFIDKRREDYDTMVFRILYKIQKNHETIFRRMSNELNNKNFDGPNFAIIQELIRTYLSCHALEKAYNVLDEQLKEITEKLENETDLGNKANEEFAKREALILKKEEELRTKGREFDRKIGSLQAENERLKKNNLMLCRDLEKAIEKQEVYERNNKNENIEEMNDLPESLCEDDVEEIIYMPDKEAAHYKVVVVGGHEKNIQKFKERFPTWTFISPGGRTDQIQTDTQLVAFFNRHMPHKTYTPCIAKCRQWNIPVVYLKWTNPDKASDIIKSHLQNLNEKQEKVIQQ